MTVSYTKQAKNTATYTKQSISAIGGGTVFYGWMFLFTIPGGSGTVTAFTSVAKP